MTRFFPSRQYEVLSALKERPASVAEIAEDDVNERMAARACLETLRGQGRVSRSARAVPSMGRGREYVYVITAKGFKRLKWLEDEKNRK